MKVCMVISSLSAGGAERVAGTLANHWVAKGWRITAITLEAQKNDFYALDPAVGRIALNMAGSSENVLTGLRNNFSRISALRRVLRREEPDITLGFMPSTNILCGLAVFGTGLVATRWEHNHPPERPPSRVWRSLRRLVYPRLAFVSALTEESAQWLKIHTGSRNVPVIPNPIAYPLSAQEPRLDPGSLRSEAGADELWLLAVGRLTGEKGFDRLLAAFARLAKKFREWRLIILGEGPLRLELEKQMADLRIEEQVVLLGAVGNIGDWYEAADAYVMTSRFEGFGNALAEALAYGLPAVAVDCENGPRHILRHDRDGLLVPQDDEDALVDALQLLMGDDGLRRRFGKHAVEARQQFAVGKVAGMWEAQFESVLGDR